MSAQSSILPAACQSSRHSEPWGRTTSALLALMRDEHQSADCWSAPDEIRIAALMGSGQFAAPTIRQLEIRKRPNWLAGDLHQL